MGEDRYTFNCSNTDPLNEKTMNDTLKRLTYFINNLKNELEKNNGKLLITLIPYQQYFDKQSKMSNLSQDYLLLRETIENSNVDYIDFNENLLKKLDPYLYFKYRFHTEKIPNNISESFTQNNIAATHFLESPPDISPFGWRHPNQKMYDLMSQTLFEYVDKLKFTL